MPDGSSSRFHLCFLISPFCLALLNVLQQGCMICPYGWPHVPLTVLHEFLGMLSIIDLIVGGSWPITEMYLSTKAMEEMFS